jgi:hypothetical protein
MEFGGGGRGAGDRAWRQLQAVGRLAAYLGGGFLVLSAASSVAVRSLRALSDANQVPQNILSVTRSRKAFFAFIAVLLRGRLATPFTFLAEEVRVAVRRLRRGGKLCVQALQGQHDHRVVPDVRSCVHQPVPLPYL